MDLESLKQAAIEAEKEWHKAATREKECQRETYLKWKAAEAASKAYFDAKWEQHIS